MNSFSSGYQAGYIVAYLSLAILLGLVPFFVGMKTGSSLLGIVGLVACIVAGLIHPGSALLTAIVFVAIILIKNR